MKYPTTPWTKDELAWFKFAFQDLIWEELILLIGKTDTQLRYKGKELGLIKKARSLGNITNCRRTHPVGFCKYKINRVKKYTYIIIKTGEPNEWEYLHRLLYET